MLTSYEFLTPGQNLEKTNDPIPRKLMDRPMYRWKDRLTLFYRNFPATVMGPTKGALNKLTIPFQIAAHIQKYCFFIDSSPAQFLYFISKKFVIFKKLQMIIYASHFMTSKLLHFQLSLTILKRWTRRRKTTKIRVSG